MDRKFNISQWHGVSTNKSIIKMEGVKYEDLKSIILALYNHPSVKSLKERLDDLYKHLINYDNPHEVNVDQFDITVFDVLYRKWLDEGYKGTKEDLFKLIAIYFEIADLRDFKDGVEDCIKLTPVKVVSDYIRLHDNGIVGGHEKIFSKIFRGESYELEPMVSLFNYLSVPVEVWEKYDEESKEYKGIELKKLRGGGSLGDRFSIVLKVRFIDKDYLRIHGDDGCEIIFRSNRSLERFQVVCNGIDKHINGLIARKSISKRYSKSEISVIDTERIIRKEIESRLGLNGKVRLMSLSSEEDESIEVYGDVENGWFGFNGGTDFVMGECIFKSMYDEVDPDDPNDLYFGFIHGTNNVFGEAPFYNDDREPIIPEYPDDPDYTYSLDLRSLKKPDWITVVVSLGDEKLRIYCENEKVHELPITRVEDEVMFMKYPIVPRNITLDIARMGHRGEYFQDRLFNDDDNKVLQIYRGYFDREELEYIFNCYK